MKSAKQSLRIRLILSFLGVIIATGGLVVVLANRITADRFTHMVSRSGQMQAHRLAPLFSDYYAQVGSWIGVEALVNRQLDTYRSPDGCNWRGSMMTGDNRKGTNCSSSGDTMSMMGMDSNYEHLLLADVSGQVIADSETHSADHHLTAAELDRGAPIVVGDQNVGTLLVSSGLGTLTPDQSDFLKQVNRLMVWAAVIAGLAVLLVGSLQARRIVAPVRALAEAARRVAGGDLSQRVPVTSQDELGEMATAFNTMAAQLEQQHLLRRRAMADIAHELRTPLSVLQIDLESIEDGLTEPTAEVITRLGEEVTLLNRLVEDLRTLSLADAGELHIEIDSVDVEELLQAATARVRGAARENGVTVSSQLPDQLNPIAGDRQRLVQVLLNLLNNALRHTPSGGQITITARQMPDRQVQVSVQDTGEGIPATDLPHVFERFYRTDRVRSRDTGGSGLGLTIARSLIEAQDGHIWAESVEGQGSTFTFALPPFGE